MADGTSDDDSDQPDEDRSDDGLLPGGSTSASSISVGAACTGRAPRLEIGSADRPRSERAAGRRPF